MSDEVQGALSEALGTDRMTVIEVPVEPRYAEAAAAKMHRQPMAIGGIR